jgi:hypothetical protein
MLYFLRIFFLVLIVNFLTWSSGKESLTFAQEKALKKNSQADVKKFKTFKNQDKNLQSNVFLLIQDHAHAETVLQY